jgi:hypothetical protein
LLKKTTKNQETDRETKSVPQVSDPSKAVALKKRLGQVDPPEMVRRRAEGNLVTAHSVIVQNLTVQKEMALHTPRAQNALVPIALSRSLNPMAQPAESVLTNKKK